MYDNTDIKKWITGLSLLLVIGFWGCEDRIDPGGEGPGQAGDVSDFLAFENSTKITGALPVAPEGALRINVPDTIYLVKDNPYRARISVLHDAAFPITGFNVQVSGADEEAYYDVTASGGESKDTVDVFYIGVETPEEELLYPYTIEIIIQPHGPDGTPFDQFTRRVTIEDPGDVCDIYTPVDAWKWMHTLGYNYQGDLFQVTAPWFSATFSEGAGGYDYGKCCIEDPDFGLIEVYPGDTTMFGMCNWQNPTYKKVFINGAYYLRAYDYLFVFQSGNFIHYSASLTSNFVPQKSRICDLFAYYDREYTAFTKTGTHDYESGDNTIKITTEVAVPKFGPTPPSGSFVNTCHLLIFNVGAEETYQIVYQRYPSVTEEELPDPMDHLAQWFE